MKERNRNLTHQQRFQGRHDEPMPPPVETQRNAAPFGPNLDGEVAAPKNEERGTAPPPDERK